MSGAQQTQRLSEAEAVKAVVDAVRSIPNMVKRARTVAIREQIYHGYEMRLARARGGVMTFSKYEHDRHWSRRARDDVRAGKIARGDRQLNRDHVLAAASLVEELLAESRTVEETADLLDARLITCTVTADAHGDLGRVPKSRTGWARYDDCNIEVLRTFDDENPCADAACGHAAMSQ